MRKWYRLLPLGVFLLIFLGSGIYLNDFYKLPSPIAALAGIVTAFLIYKAPFKKKMSRFFKGCQQENILTMCFVYLFSGAFTSVAKAIGAMDFMVKLGLHFFTGNSIFVGVFTISCLLSFAIGSSVGTLVALTPIVFGFAENSLASLPLLCGCLLGGAMFGDNLSFISDTTIASTQMMKVPMRAKFKSNFWIATISALIAIVLILWTQPEFQFLESEGSSTNYLLLLPYICLIILAICGVHVFVTLISSILVGLSVGMFYNTQSIIELIAIIYNGFVSMHEIFFLSLFSGGLSFLLKKEGGIQLILSVAKKIIFNKQSAYMAIALVVSLVNISIANNTISIVLSGSVAKEISSEYNLNKSLATSVLDIFSCIVQGLLPYGAQMLLLMQLTSMKVNYFDIFRNSYYLIVLFFVTIVSLIVKSLRKNHSNSIAVI